MSGQGESGGGKGEEGLERLEMAHNGCPVAIRSGCSDEIVVSEDAHQPKPYIRFLPCVQAIPLPPPTIYGTPLRSGNTTAAGAYPGIPLALFPMGVLTSNVPRLQP